MRAKDEINSLYCATENIKQQRKVCDGNNKVNISTKYHNIQLNISNKVPNEKLELH